jgi:hypothetical protein
MYGDIDPAFLQMARWLEGRIRAQEARFPHLVVLKANIRAATEAIDAATNDEERARAIERQTAACYALMTALPTTDGI